MSTIDGNSSDTDRQDATFVVEPGRADDSCYSFESVDFPGRFLRHYDFRVRLDAPSGSTFDTDATFCAQPGNNGTGISLQSVNFPDRYVRNYDGEVWIASNGGPRPSDTTVNWADDSSWFVQAPLAPAV